MTYLTRFVFVLLLSLSVIPHAFAQSEGDMDGAQMVNINTADRQSLTSLDGIGEAKADAIVTWRDKNGEFESKKQLLQVKGIGKATLADNRDNIVLR